MDGGDRVSNPLALRAYVRQALNSVALFDAHLRCIEVSEDWTKTFGSCPGVIEEHLALLSRGLTEVNAQPYEDQWIDPHGVEHWMRWTVVGLRNEAGTVDLVIMSALDVTDRMQAERRLRESEQRYTTIFDASPFASALTRMPDHVVVSANAAFLELFGWTREEALGKTDAELGLSDLEGQAQIHGRLEAHGAVRDFECTRRTRSGDRRRVSLNLDWVTIGGRKHVLTTIRDLTELHQAREHQRRLEDIEAASIAVTEALASVPESSLRAVLNTIALRAQALTRAEIVAVGLGSSVDEPFDPWVHVGMEGTDIPGLREPPRPVGALGFTVGTGARRVRDPKLDCIRSFMSVCIRFHERPVGMLFLANKRGADDFTDHDERVVEMLAGRVGVAIETAWQYRTVGLERAWLEAVIEQMPEAVVIVDAVGRLTTRNRAADTLAAEVAEHGDRFRLELRRVSGEALAPEDLPVIRVLHGDEPAMPLELVAHCANGNEIPLLVTATQIRLHDGQLGGATMVLQDITPLKEVERLREEWASIIAHELQQPINAMVLLADLLLDTELAEKERERIARIRALSFRLSKMVSDISDVSQIDTHRLVIERNRIDLVGLVRETVQRVPAIATRASVSTHVAHPTVQGDPGRIEQVLTNLLSNALKYATPDSQIDIDLEERPQEIEVSVTNRGTGIPAEELPRLFARFARTPGARASSTKGSGLGLYIARGIVEAHGGRIWAESVPQQTTTFHFTIPVAA